MATITYDRAGDKVIITPDTPVAEEYTRDDIEAKIAEYNSEISYAQAQITPLQERIDAATINRDDWQAKLNGLDAAM